MPHPTTPRTIADVLPCVADVFARHTPHTAFTIADTHADIWQRVGRPDLADAIRTEAVALLQHMARAKALAAAGLWDTQP